MAGEFKYEIGQSLVVTGDSNGYGHEFPDDTVVDVIHRMVDTNGAIVYDCRPVGKDHSYWVEELDLKRRHLPGFGQPEKDDAVNHPRHYTWGPVEVIEITENLGFCLGNVVKYVLRADHKGKPIEDLKKAQWYLEREIARREKEGQ